MTRFWILVLLPVFSFAQESDSLRLEKYISAFISLNKFNGTVLVVKDKKELLKKSFGFSDKEHKQPNSADTKFRIASCSKQFTAIALLQLQQEGKLSVTDKLSKYFPRVQKSERITLEMLVMHRSGIHDFTNDDKYHRKTNTPKLTQKKMMALIEKAGSDFEPGSKHHYSNPGYFLLAAVVEKVSGLSFENYMSINIFNNAGMNSSGVESNTVSVPGLATGFTENKKNLVPAPFDNMDASMGFGNLYSTANDLYKYYQAIEENKLLTLKARKQFLTPTLVNSPPTVMQADGSYAYGIIADTLNGHPFVTHGGSGYGFTSDLTVYLDDKALIVVLSNNEANVWSLSKGLQGILFDPQTNYPYKYKAIEMESKALDKFCGTYGLVKIYKKHNQLYVDDMSDNDGEGILIPEAENKFYIKGENDRQVEFSLDKNQKVTNAFVIWGGVKYKLDKTQ